LVDEEQSLSSMLVDRQAHIEVEEIMLSVEVRYMTSYVAEAPIFLRRFSLVYKHRVRVGVVFSVRDLRLEGEWFSWNQIAFNKILIDFIYLPRTKSKVKQSEKQSISRIPANKINVPERELLVASLLLLRRSPSISPVFHSNMSKNSGHLYGSVSIFHSPSVLSGP
jgi:hypothetical protein